MRKNGRWCPACDKKYELKGHEDHSNDPLETEQFLSGICSTKCFEIMTGSGLYSDKFGQQADQVTILTDENGKAKALKHVWKNPDKMKKKNKKKKKKKGWNSGFLL